MKKCTTCKSIKPLTEYHADKRASDGKCHECRMCRNNRTRIHHQRHYSENPELCKASTEKRRLKNREQFNSFKSTLSCIFCNEAETSCLDFHHTDPTSKEVEISKVVDSWSWNRLMKEVAKCVTLCSNCHRKVHAGKLVLPC